MSWIDDRELDAGGAERERERSAEATGTDDRRARHAALRPQTLHAPSSPITPTQAPSGQSLRSVHSPGSASPSRRLVVAIVVVVVVVVLVVVLVVVVVLVLVVHRRRRHRRFASIETALALVAPVRGRAAADLARAVGADDADAGAVGAELCADPIRSCVPPSAAIQIVRDVERQLDVAELERSRATRAASPCAPRGSAPRSQLPFFEPASATTQLACRRGARTRAGARPSCRRSRCRCCVVRPIVMRSGNDAPGFFVSGIDLEVDVVDRVDRGRAGSVSSISVVERAASSMPPLGVVRVDRRGSARVRPARPRPGTRRGRAARSWR